MGELQEVTAKPGFLEDCINEYTHLEEDLHTLTLNISDEKWHTLETAVAAIPVVCDRYNAGQQKQVVY